MLAKCLWFWVTIGHPNKLPSNKLAIVKKNPSLGVVATLSREPPSINYRFGRL